MIIGQHLPISIPMITIKWFKNGYMRQVSPLMSSNLTAIMTSLSLPQSSVKESKVAKISKVQLQQ